jgi:hypothetical protein
LPVIIDEVELRENFADFGLPKINLYKLDHLVAIVGANGVGKTRLFEIMRSELLSKPHPEIRFHREFVGKPLIACIPPELGATELQKSDDVSAMFALRKTSDEPHPPLNHNALCLKSFDDGNAS